MWGWPKAGEAGRGGYRHREVAGEAAGVACGGGGVRSGGTPEKSESGGDVLAEKVSLCWSLDYGLILHNLMRKTELCDNKEVTEKKTEWAV
jgi:hypothetical protein